MVYMQTLQTSAEAVQDIQVVKTSAAVGQTLGGGFKLSYKGDQTHMLPFNVEPDEMKRALESAFTLGGLFEVTRSRPDAQVECSGGPHVPL